LDGIDVNTMSAYATAAGAIFAGLALIYNARQTKAATRSYKEAETQSRIAAQTLSQSAKVYYYQIMKDFSDQIQDLQGSDKRNKDHRSFSIRYLNIFDRLVYLANKDVIQQKDVLAYFEDSIRGAKGLFEMKEYGDYLKRFKELNDWCDNAKIAAGPPPLPYPNIRIKNGLIYDKLYNAKEGDFVTWITEDSEKHRIMSGKDQNDPNKGQEFDSGASGVLALTNEGRSFSHEFKSGGSYDYFCHSHPTEVGKVIVQ
jgi:hypothetical protein